MLRCCLLSLLSAAWARVACVVACVCEGSPCPAAELSRKSRTFCRSLAGDRVIHQKARDAPPAEDPHTFKPVINKDGMPDFKKVHQAFK